MHIIKPVLELSNECGQSNSGSGWKERVGAEVEVGDKAFASLLHPHFFFSPLESQHKPSGEN